jgi:hypothetical protein
VSWLFPGKEVHLETRCLDCGESITVSMKDGTLLDTHPETTVGYITLPLREWATVANAFL